MKMTVRENIIVPYSLHDMNVICFDIYEDSVIMRTQSGMVRTVGVCEQVDGYVKFEKVDFDFSFVCFFDAIGKVGKFSGEKMMLADFLERYKVFGFSIIDEVYGYNQTKYWGHISSAGEVKECIIEIYHNGDMIFVEE